MFYLNINKLLSIPGHQLSPSIDTHNCLPYNGTALSIGYSHRTQDYDKLE